MKIALRVFGDIHAKFEPYIKLAQEADNSICVGDVGFFYVDLNVLDNKRHVIVAGNHDNYDNLSHHFLGDFGVHSVAGFDIFYVRGAWSVDHKHRTPGRDWWWQEELSNRQMNEALKAYENFKPEFVITHDAPLSVISQMDLFPLGPDFDIGPQRTPRLLEMMLNIHKPKTWIFGHFHRSWRKNIEGTDFICLNILEHIDFDEFQKAGK